MKSNTRVTWNPDYYLSLMSFDSMVEYLGIHPRSLRTQIRRRRINIENLKGLKARVQYINEVQNGVDQGKKRASDEDIERLIRVAKTKYVIKKELSIESSRLNNYLTKIYNTTDLKAVQAKLGVEV